MGGRTAAMGIPLCLLLVLPLLAVVSASPTTPLPLVALLSLKSCIRDPTGALKTWTYSVSSSSGAAQPLAKPWCAWPGVSCDAATGDIVGIDLSLRDLSGTIPAITTRLLSPTLTSLNLSGNGFAGALPSTVFLLRRLSKLSIDNNRFNSSFPDGLAEMVWLTSLDASNNTFVGPLPHGLGKLKQMKYLNLAGNQFSGSIPADIGELRQLRQLNLHDNSLTGRLPGELGRLTMLEELNVGYNVFSGGIPIEIGNLTRLRSLGVANAGLSGQLPSELGSLKELKLLMMFQNQLTGVIPPQWRNLRKLQVLDLSWNLINGTLPNWLGHLDNLKLISFFGNFLSGTIPAKIGALPELQVVRLGNNSLSGYLPDNLGSNGRLREVEVSMNKLSGPIPSGLCSGTRLNKLILYSNSFEGEIPRSLSNCSSLVRLRAQSNRIVGPLPAWLGLMPKLTYLDISSNSLKGPIPEHLFKSSSLQYINVSGNAIGGVLPDNLWQSQQLQVFSASHCALGGRIGVGAAGCSDLFWLDLAHNQLMGPIPAEISRCTKLQILFLQKNQLTGRIPSGLLKLPALTVLDLSSNNLTGALPPGILNSNTLESFNISGNNLGILVNGSHGKPSRSGDTTSTNSGQAGQWKFVLIGVAVLFTVLTLVGTAIYCLRWGHKNCKDSVSTELCTYSPWKIIPYSKIEFSAYDVVRSMSGAQLIGAGSSGEVYLANILGIDIAIKKLNARAGEDMVSEVQILSDIRHRSILPLLAFCTDGDVQMLIFEYMRNGCLRNLLHSADHNLDWDSRYKIAIDIANAVSYLHADCKPPVLHGDLNPNNVLISTAMEGRVTDFGLARLLKNGNVMPTGGTIGYMAPEYGLGIPVDLKSDVYSFGIVLMEILTGRRAVLVEDGESVNIEAWVRQKRSISGGRGDGTSISGAADEDLLEEVMDARVWPLLSISGRREMAQALSIALMCTKRLPGNRPPMRTVLSLLLHLKGDGTSVPSSEVETQQD